MEDLTLRYDEAELHYIKDAAREFALQHPGQASMMRLTTPGAADDAVERLRASPISVDDCVRSSTMITLS